MNRKETPAQEGGRLLTEQSAEQAKEAGFDLDFVFEAKPEEEALIKELRSIEISTFWVHSPFEPRVAEADMAPGARAEYQQLIARKAEIVSQKEHLLTYLAPYVSAAEVWEQRPISQSALDGALNYWTTKHGDAHRQRFLATISLLWA